MIGWLLFNFQWAVFPLYSERGHFQQYIQTIQKWGKGSVNRVSDFGLSLLLKRYGDVRRGVQFSHLQQKGEVWYNLLKQSRQACDRKKMKTSDWLQNTRCTIHRFIIEMKFTRKKFISQKYMYMYTRHKKTWLID